MKDIVKFATTFGLQYEILESSFTTGYLNMFAFPNNACFFFDLAETITTAEYLEHNYDNIIEAFKFTNKNFIFLPKEVNLSNPVETYKYYLPRLASLHEALDIGLKKTASLPYKELYEKILNSIGYKGLSRTGFIIRNNHNLYVLGVDDSNFFRKDGTIVENLIIYLRNQVVAESQARDAFGSVNYILENVDQETKDKINQIETQLKQLKKSGQLLLVLPVLQELLSEHTEINLNTVSQIHIDSNYSITLPSFNNLEVKMSHLTKSVYILFHNNPQGIDLNDFKRFKDNLFEIYLKISPLSDLDKINKSVEDIVNVETKAIYTHISRVKSAFLKLMDYKFAKHYIIDGKNHGSSFKSISILQKNSSEFDSF